jgi:D-alanyl-lipoteichoic acid acyltransferase DltB (MBOAT superfamily)
MLFNSQVFVLVFLPLCLGAFALLRRIEATNTALKLALLAASWVFYTYWDLRLFPVLLGSLLVNYSLSRMIVSKVLHPRVAIALVAALNLGYLGYFKYMNFFSSTIGDVTGIETPAFTVWLPLGISFFTFQQISYLVDLAKGRARLYPAIDYCLYISFFPQLIAGPIVRHHQLVPQFATLGPVTHDQIARGITFFTIGLAKKVILADQLAALIAPVYSASRESDVAALDAWIAGLGFAFQVYYDFSAYSDMAIGLALFFGLTIPFNFDSPYKATSLTELWRRWHMTLTSFLRDYVYVPLGLSLRRFKRTRNYVALFVTFLLSGLWHGAGWNFFLWGAWNGAGLCANLLWQRSGYRLPGVIAWALTFWFWTSSCFLFRAESLDSAAALFRSGFFFAQEPVQTLIALVPADIFLLSATLMMVMFCPNSQEIAAMNWWRRVPVGLIAGAGAVVLIFYLGGGREQEFIYFNF